MKDIDAPVPFTLTGVTETVAPSLKNAYIEERSKHALTLCVKDKLMNRRGDKYTFVVVVSPHGSALVVPSPIDIPRTV